MRLAYRLPDRRFNRLRALVARLRRRSYGEPCDCGLLHEHPGSCVWWTPGGYLRLAPPLLHPLDPLPGPRAGMPDCPGCGRVVFGIDCDDGEVWVVRDEHSAIAYGQPTAGASHEATLRFEPCGCERREILGTLN
jgi:hypothetical protein